MAPHDASDHPDALAGPPAEALDEALWAAAFDELKALAHARLRTAGPLTGLNTTALVHEGYLKLVARAGELSFASRSHFFAYASKVMRSVIVDLLRERAAARRGGDQLRVTLDSALLGQVLVSEDEPLRVDEALQSLEAVEPRLAQVVEMRYFVGLSDVEIADLLGVTDRTVRRDWDKARALLKAMLG